MIIDIIPFIYTTILINSLYQFSAETKNINDNRIIGGRPALQDEFPYQVSLRRSYNFAHFCGGSIINSVHVVTAAHCMYFIWGAQLPPDLVTVIAGQLDLKLNNNSIIRNVSSIKIHPNYNKHTMENDLAVITLKQPFELNNTPLMQAIPLNRNKFVTNLDCVVSGWGVKAFHESQLSDSLLASPVQIISQDLCQMKYAQINVTIYDGMLCATFSEKAQPVDACQGDSGGPLVCENTLTGIISTGHGCGNVEYPGIYTKVEYYLEWLQQVTIVPGLTSSSEPSINATFVSGSNPLIRPLVIYYDNRNITQVTIINNNNSNTDGKSSGKMTKLRFIRLLFRILFSLIIKL